jgi:hypothetical protein
MVLHDVPHDVERDPEIVMDNPVAHARHVLPRDVRVRVAHLGRDLLGRLPDDLKVAYDGILRFQALPERAAPSRGVRANPVASMK